LLSRVPICNPHATSVAQVAVTYRLRVIVKDARAIM